MDACPVYHRDSFAPGQLTCCSVGGRGLTEVFRDQRRKPSDPLPRAAARPAGGAGKRGGPGGRRRPRAVARMAVGRQAQHRRGARPAVVIAGRQGSTGSYGLPVLGTAMAITCLPGLCYTGWCWRRRAELRRAAPEREYQQALAEWDVRAADHAAAEDRMRGRAAVGQPRSPPRGGPTSSAGRSADCKDCLRSMAPPCWPNGPFLSPTCPASTARGGLMTAATARSARHGLPHAHETWAIAGLLAAAAASAARYADPPRRCTGRHWRARRRTRPGDDLGARPDLDVQVLQQLAGVAPAKPRCSRPGGWPPPSAARSAAPSRTPRLPGAAGQGTTRRR